ncbi:hypothetical protein HDV57DRAFT_310088 [Trichoderma longibrachiatum]
MEIAAEAQTLTGVILFLFLSDWKAIYLPKVSVHALVNSFVFCVSQTLFSLSSICFPSLFFLCFHLCLSWLLLILGRDGDGGDRDVLLTLYCAVLVDARRVWNGMLYRTKHRPVQGFSFLFFFLRTERP